MAGQGWRSAPMPKGWRRTRLRVLRRDGYACQWDMDTGGKCGEPANEVDHIVPVTLGGSEGLANLQALCAWHHTRKSRGEAAFVSHAKPPRVRPQEEHPGYVN